MKDPAALQWYSHDRVRPGWVIDILYCYRIRFVTIDRRDSPSGSAKVLGEASGGLLQSSVAHMGGMAKEGGRDS